MTRVTADAWRGTLLAAIWLLPAIAFASGSRPVAADRIVASTRILDDSLDVSPDGTRYLFRLVTGDIAADGTRIEVYTGKLADLDHAAPRRIARFLTSGRGWPNSITGPEQDPFHSPLRWIGNDRAAFLLSDRKGIRQVVEIDIETGASSFLTRHSTPVFSFDISAQRTVVFQAQSVGSSPLPLDFARRGIAIGLRTDGWAAAQNVLNGESTLDIAWNSEWFASDAGRGTRSIMVNGERIDRALPVGRLVVISNSGRHVLLNTMSRTIPDFWLKYDQPDTVNLMRYARRDPLSFNGRRAWQPIVYDLLTHASRPLWNAPISLIAETVAAWSPDDESIVLANTFLPANVRSDEGLRGTAAAVVKVASGAFQPLDLATVLPKAARVYGVSWEDANTIEVRATGGDGADIAVVMERTGERWAAREGWQQRSHAPVRLEVRQSLARPPRIYAVDDAAGRERLLLSTNPELHNVGRVEILRGGEGVNEWAALAMYPPQFSSHRRYPLVIQGAPSRNGISEHVFTSSGDQVFTPLGPPTVAGYCGQELASQGFIVVTLGAAGDFAHQAASWISAVEAVVERLSAAGHADPRRVGLVGFSRMGYLVFHTLVHSKSRFAAAIALDNYDASYVQTALAEWDRANEDIGAAPFGEGLKRWLAQATGFNVGRIDAPLLLVAQSEQAVIGNWEVFSRLRHLDRPVEMFVMPDAIARPAHSPQSPVQILVMRERVLDWLGFWLMGKEEEDPVKRDQYDGWRLARKISAEAQSANRTRSSK